MAGLGILLYGLLQAIGAVGYAVDDAQSKRNSVYVNERGQTVCYGRKGQQYINGEPTYTWSEQDKYGNTHNLTIGRNSGKVYHDSYDDKAREWNAETERHKREAVERNKASYDMFDPRFEKYVKIETSTGKRISCLYKGTNPETHKPEYRKFYWSEELFDRYGKYRSYNMTQEGDMGILISKEEYLSLYFSAPCASASIANLPSDNKVLNKLFGVNCF